MRQIFPMFAVLSLFFVPLFTAEGEVGAEALAPLSKQEIETRDAPEAPVEPEKAEKFDKYKWLDKSVEAAALYKNYLVRRYHLATGEALPGTPDLEKLEERLKKAGLRNGAPVFLRVFKREAKLELWLFKDKKFELFATYPVCRFSGLLGPKQKTGDRQSPEGFYTVRKGQLNPNSAWLRSFNLGYPNLFDRAHGRTGSYLMVHGGCASIGCYAMTNPVIKEVWALITKALNNGQKRIHVHAFPFRPSRTNMYIHGANKWHPFWQQLQAGYDVFEATKLPPYIGVCKGRYTVKAAKPGSRGSHRLSKKCYADTVAAK